MPQNFRKDRSCHSITQQAQEIGVFLAKLRCSLHLRPEAPPSSLRAVTSYSDKIESRWLPHYCKHDPIKRVRHLPNSQNPSSYNVEHPSNTTFFTILLTLNFAQAPALTEAYWRYFFLSKKRVGYSLQDNQTTKPVLLSLLVFTGANQILCLRCIDSCSV